MKKIIFFFFLIICAYSEIMKKDKFLFLSKTSNNLTFHKNVTSLNIIKELYEAQNDPFTYEIDKIKEVVNKYNFPENYNFFEATNVKKVIKDQGSCGSCWAFASTTALSYRFNKLGYNLDLAPQDPLSCFLKSCEIGSSALNAVFNLVRNGTVTEKCFPYTSGNSQVKDECIKSCKDGSEYIKYYAKNSYSMYYNLNKDNYYDTVAIIMDQLVNHGPVITSIKLYNNFYSINSLKNCENYIYTNQDNTQDYSGHALVIVGYGYSQFKYYWLAQNSWGENFCNGGLIKIEFGQIGIERVTFLEPYILSENRTTIEVPVNLNINGECKVKFSTSSSEDTLKNSFEIRPKSSDSSDKLYYQCGLISLPDDKEKLCSMNSNYDSFFNKKKGTYKIEQIETLGNENKYNIENPISFYYYGIDLINSFFSNSYMYVSESQSRIMFRYVCPVNDKSLVSKIYINKNSTQYLKNCQLEKLYENVLSVEYIVYCTIGSDELDYFIDPPKNEDSYLSYDVLCGSREIISATVVKLDKTKYPVFRIKKFVLNDEKYITGSFKLIADIEGSLSYYTTEINSFIVLANVKSSKDLTLLGYCEIQKPEIIVKDFEINCNFASSFNGDKIEYESISLNPYSYPSRNVYTSPFEIIISSSLEPTIVKVENIENKETDKISDTVEDIPIRIRYSYSNFTKITLVLLLYILILV